MSVLQNQLKAGALIANMPQFVKKTQKAKADIIAMIRTADRSYLSCSWGKQSIILAHMVYELGLNIPVVFFDKPDTDIICNFKQVRDEFLQKWPVNYVEIMDGQGSPRRSAKDYVEQNNMNGVIMGLAKHESKARFYTLIKADRNNIFEYATGMFRCCPLARWGLNDYAAYIAKNDIMLLDTYVKYGLESRTSAGITPNRPSYAGREFLKSSSQTELDKRWKERNVFQSDIQS